MANKIIKTQHDGIAHCYDCSPSYDPALTNNPEVDKTKTIAELSQIELQKLINRLRTARVEHQFFFAPSVFAESSQSQNCVSKFLLFRILVPSTRDL